MPRRLIAEALPYRDHLLPLHGSPMKGHAIMSTTCHACGKPVEAKANRCPSCGRSLIAKPGTGIHTAKPAAPAASPSASTASRASAAPSSSTAPGASTDSRLSDFVVHGIIAVITGAACFGVVALLFLRSGPSSDGASGLTFFLVFLVGFCLPAAYAFHTSYKKSEEAKERKRHGLIRTSEYPSIAEETSTKPYVGPTRMSVSTPHYERRKLEYLPGSCTLDDDLLQAWRELMGPVADEAQLIPRNYLFTSLEGGDAQPAIVVQSDANLIIVSAYSDEFDSYVFIGFTGAEREKLVSDGFSAVGTRLLCAWKYGEFKFRDISDIVMGKNNSSQYASGEVAIIDLLAKDAKRIDYLKRLFGDKMYKTVLEGSHQLLASGKVTKLRSGSPLIGSYQYLDYTPAPTSVA
jgi:DNA-directed RNA polymerase subunit RPC12/RpoP